MRASYLPKFAVAVLVLAAAVVLLSGQAAQVAATPSVSNYCDYYGYYNSTYSYYYGYPYYYYYYYGYPYYYSYNYPYYDCYYGNYGYYNYGYNYGYNNYYSYYNTPSQYKLTVTTDPANLATVTGGGTYNQGSSASFSVTQTTIQSSAEYAVCFLPLGR